MESGLSLTYIGHATVLIEINGVRILTDPVLHNHVSGFLRRQVPLPADHVGPIDAVLISHLHRDHLDLPSLRLLDPNTRCLVPAGAAAFLQRYGFYNVEELRPGEQTTVKRILIEATGAAHSGFRPPFGPTADCLGFVIRGQQSIYFAGDTDLFPEMDMLDDNLDVALLPIWGWGPTLGTGHMDPQRAAEALTLLEPRFAIPIHWGTLFPWGLSRFRPHFLFAPPYLFARHARQLAPEVQIHIVEPGQGLDLFL